MIITPSFKLEGFVKITDPKSKEVLLDKKMLYITKTFQFAWPKP